MNKFPFFLLGSLASVACAVDYDFNGLSDLWEQRFDASGLEMFEDVDGDGFNNLEECIAGTDPYSLSDLPKLDLGLAEVVEGEMGFGFRTVEGRSYAVKHSADLVDFEVIGDGFWGDSSLRQLQIRKSGLAQTASPIRAEFWADLSGSTIDALYDHPDFPSDPDGKLSTEDLAAPIFAASQYGARIHFSITPPEAGAYTFYLSAGGPAELFLVNQGGDGPAEVKIAEVLPLQAGLKSGEWEVYASQTSNPVQLSVDGSYELELRYVSVGPRQHAEIAWSGPGVDGIRRLDRNDLSEVTFHADTEPLTTLLAHDYDMAGQTGQLWPRSYITQGVLGFEGFAELIAGDVVDDDLGHVNLFQTTTSHFYATWRFRMDALEQLTRLIFMNGTDSEQEGPLIDFQSRDVVNGLSTVSAVVSGGQEILLDFYKNYRVEMIGTLAAGGFNYQTPTKQFSVAQDTYDIYISDANGNLVGSATGLAFQDAGVEAISSMRLIDLFEPSIFFDEWEITSGQIIGSGYLVANNVDFGDQDDPNFFSLEIQEQDQDGDGILDWEELLLAEHFPLLFFDAHSASGIADDVSLEGLLSEAVGEIEVALYASDAAAFESNFPSTTPDDGEITITRTGPLTPVTVKLCVAPLAETGNTATVCDGTCCILVGSAGDEEAEAEDYQLIDSSGNVITDTVEFGFGEMVKVLTLKAVEDTVNEYPETVNLAVATSTDGSYTVSETQNGASIQIFDLPDNPDNMTVFTGTFSQDGAAVIATSGSGVLNATINGTRTELRIWCDFSGLTSAQQDAHIHKSGIGPSTGPIIYAITQTPGDPESDPLLGQLTDYLWDISSSSGAVPTAGGAASKQAIIDSLFKQNGETPLYFNVHTIDNPAGEIWAFLNSSEGSYVDPGDAAPASLPGSTDYPQLSGELLEVEVRRFLNQATFGATDTAVNELIEGIEQARIADPEYHRNTAFAEWIDQQINATDQTYLLDYTLASHYQYMTLSHLFDPVINPSQGEFLTPDKPTVWAGINRDNSNPEHWYLEDQFPMDFDDYRLTLQNGVQATPTLTQRRQTHWQMMLNAHDQLRQKMGYALQQIVVVSDSLVPIADTPYGTANYQDMLNNYAFDYYRDVLGYVNWSPVMAKWLSSLQNQKSIDFDGDGLYDSFPDENLARENMQLFSIGLFDMWSDGTLKLNSEGFPQATYTNDDIREFARILTGQSFSRYNQYFSLQPWGGSPYVSDNEVFGRPHNPYGVFGMSYLYPMKMFGEYHSLGAKTFAGTTIDNSALNDSTAEGIADVEAAIDWLAGKPGDGLPDYNMVNSHISTPAFISRLLIQRFTTSNPSTEYLHRVATVFKNSEGNLGQTIHAILLDPEARNIDIGNTTFGMKKSPLEAYVQMLRSLEVFTYSPITDPAGASPFLEAPGDYSNAELYLDTFGYPVDQIDNHERNFRALPTSASGGGTLGLQMDPFSQPTVFNYYLPDYAPTGSISDSGMVAPELQLATEPDVMRNINYFDRMVRNSVGIYGVPLGGYESNQIIAFGGDLDAGFNDRFRLPREQLANRFYPDTEPTSQLTTVADGRTLSVAGSTAQAPHWVRLSRTGDVFVASESIDGITWTEITTQVLPLNEEVYIGLALTSHEVDTLTTAEFSSVSITGGDGTWYHSDIGYVLASGSMVSTGVNAYQLEGSGHDIWGTDDSFHFSYQRLDGDGTIVAKVDSLLVTDEWAKAGVMIRETLDSDAANVFTFISGSQGVRAQWRAVERGRSSESLADEALVDELDLRLTNGLFKLRYPYDLSDNDDPNTYGLDERFKNPREHIIDALTNGYADPYDGSSDGQDRLNKLFDALYLLTFTPEYQIKK